MINRTIFCFWFWFEAAAQWHDQSVTLQCCDTASMQWNHLVQVPVVRKWAWSWLGGGCGLTPGGEVSCEYYVLWGRKGCGRRGAVQSLLGQKITQFLLLLFHRFLYENLKFKIFSQMEEVWCYIPSLHLISSYTPASSLHQQTQLARQSCREYTIS